MMISLLQIGSQPLWISYRSMLISDVDFHVQRSNSTTELQIKFVTILQPQVPNPFAIPALSRYRTQSKHYILFDRATEELLESQ